MPASGTRSSSSSAAAPPRAAPHSAPPASARSSSTRRSSARALRRCGPTGSRFVGYSPDRAPSVADAGRHAAWDSRSSRGTGSRYTPAHITKPEPPLEENPLTARLAVALLLIATPSAIAAPAPELTVFAAASLAESLQEIGAAYEKAGGSHVAFNFGASSTLARQISEGAPADVFFSADEAKMDGLAHHGHVLAETRRSPLANSLVFVVAAGSSIRIASARDLLDASIRVVALAEPQSVPAGIYAKAYLRSIGVWGDVIDKVV